MASKDASTTSGRENGKSDDGKTGRKVLFYKSPMDPSYISKKPGKDPMGMDLVPVYEGDPAADLDTIQVKGATVQKMGVRIAPVRREKLTRLVRALGRVEFRPAAQPRQSPTDHRYGKQSSKARGHVRAMIHQRMPPWPGLIELAPDSIRVAVHSNSTAMSMVERDRYGGSCPSGRTV